MKEYQMDFAERAVSRDLVAAAGLIEAAGEVLSGSFVDVLSSNVIEYHCFVPSEVAETDILDLRHGGQILSAIIDCSTPDLKIHKIDNSVNLEWLIDNMLAVSNTMSSPLFVSLCNESGPTDAWLTRCETPVAIYGTEVYLYCSRHLNRGSIQKLVKNSVSSVFMFGFLTNYRVTGDEFNIEANILKELVEGVSLVFFKIFDGEGYLLGRMPPTAKIT